MCKYKVSVLLVLICLYGCLMGQKKERPQYVGGYYGISIPTVKNLMNNPSWILPSAEYTWYALPWFAFGGNFEYSSSHKNGITSDQYEGDQVNGYTERQMSSFQCGIPLYFSFPAQHRFEPYTRLEVGISNITYKITGDQINHSFIRQWSGFAGLGCGCRYFFNEGRRWGLDLCAKHKWSNSSWKLMDIRNDHRFELSLGFLIKI